MKLPRGVSAGRLIRTLEGLGYEVLRQKGSHVRLRHEGPPVHTVTVPLHSPLKTGTLLRDPHRNCAHPLHYHRHPRRIALKCVRRPAYGETVHQDVQCLAPPVCRRSNPASSPVRGAPRRHPTTMGTSLRAIPRPYNTFATTNVISSAWGAPAANSVNDFVTASTIALAGSVRCCFNTSMKCSSPYSSNPALVASVTPSL
jgi:predicted RNA binding protein YcfA (HicA-like mRNA interferase family)